MREVLDSRARQVCDTWRVLEAESSFSLLFGVVLLTFCTTAVGGMAQILGPQRAN